MKFIYVTLISLLLFSGCKVKKPGNYSKLDNALGILKSSKTDYTKTKPYYLRFKPIVGSRQNDSKVVVDMGKVLKIWVAPYKVKGTMVASHDIYTWVQKPGFIVGESIPKKGRHTGLTNASGNLPFIFNEGDIDTSNGMTNKALKKYVNNVYKAQNDDTYVKKRINKTKSKFDATIKEYLNQKGRK